MPDNPCNKLVKCYLNETDYLALMEEYQWSELKSVSAFLRRKLMGSGKIVVQSGTLIAQLDVLGTQIGKTGNNINQVARKIHVFDKKGQIPGHFMHDYHDLMREYLQLLHEVQKANRSLIRLLQ